MNSSSNRIIGGALIVIGLLLAMNTLGVTDFGIGDLWPFFLNGPAVGLFELYLFGYRQPGLLIPVVVLTVIALVFLGINLLSGLLGGGIGVGLVLLGVYLVFGRSKKRDDIEL
ncbi:MAG TPA: hypothetical protein VFV52_03005 [Bacilli bacterium]|nr:hypothetical protein [Bacilli bacterium]